MTSVARTVTSRDGTPIGFRTQGRGPALLLVHGALGASDDLSTLASALADRFTVHAMDRRGRGLSGPQGAEYGMDKECEDLDAVRAATGSTLLFGHSYGGLAALEAARARVPFARLALYEPKVPPRPASAEDWAWLRDSERALEAGDAQLALVKSVRGAGHVDRLSHLPDWLVRLLLRVGLGRAQLERMLALLPSSLREHREARRLQRTASSYREVRSDVLLMCGGDSPPAAHAAMAGLARNLPRTRSVTLPWLDHLGPDDRHAPVELAVVLQYFFSSAFSSAFSCAFSRGEP